MKKLKKINKKKKKKHCQEKVIKEMVVAGHASLLTPHVHTCDKVRMSPPGLNRVKLNCRGYQSHGGVRARESERERSIH